MKSMVLTDILGMEMCDIDEPHVAANPGLWIDAADPSVAEDKECLPVSRLAEGKDAIGTSPALVAA